jgi:hypothetical protein
LLLLLCAWHGGVLLAVRSCLLHGMVSFLLVFLVRLGMRCDERIVGFTDTALNILWWELVAGFSFTVSYTEW